MEEDDVDDLDADRVGLLATLAARGRDRAKGGRSGTHRTLRSQVRGASSKRAPSRGELWASPWWGRALFGLMALGAIAVLYSFVQVVQQPHAMSAKARAAGHASEAAAASQTTALAATDLETIEAPAAGTDTAKRQDAVAGATTASPGTAPGASPDASFQDVAAMAGARIEVVPPTGATPRLATSTTAQADAPQPGRPPAPTHAALVARAAADAARLNAPAAAPPQTLARTASAREANARNRGNDDVALLEAMMKHASARREPPSSAEALQTCAALQGADAAVCRAKACVQHPTAPQCHSDAP